jgi:hypothetical protein
MPHQSLKQKGISAETDKKQKAESRNDGQKGKGAAQRRA